MYTRLLSALTTFFLLLFSALVDTKPMELPAIEVVPIKDSGTGRDYELYVKVPEDYDAASAKKHPVIYIVDARWNMEVISGAIEYFVADAILVGISWEMGAKAQQSRLRDYTPVKHPSEDFKSLTGEAERHIAFLKNDVINYVENNYQANPAKRSLYGYSLGGEFASYILLTQTQMFENYMIGSPSTLPGGAFIHEYEPFLKRIPEQIQANVFLSVGAEEKTEQVHHAFSLARYLNEHKVEGASVEFSVINHADHGRAFPASVLQSLIWLAER